MKYLVSILVALFFGYNGYSQIKESTESEGKDVDLLKSTISLTKLDHNQYSLNYLNGMNGKGDFRSIVFKNKRAFNSFISSLEKAFRAKDGVTSMVVYDNYKIRLLTEMGGIFMIVDERGKTQSTFRITRENYEQINAL